jgi:hypothetical protein
VQTETGIRTNLQIVGVGGTSVGKDHARKCNKAFLSAAGLSDFLGGEEVASGAALLGRMGDQPNTLFQLDEFGLMMQAIVSPKSGSHKAEIMSSMMKMFSSSGTIFHGAEYADRKMRQRKDIPYPCLNVYATTTAEMMWPALNSSHSASGFLNRLLFVFEPTVRIKRRHTTIKQPPESAVEWAKAARAANIGNEGLNYATPITVPMSERALDEFDAFDDWIADRMDESRFMGLDALWGRAWEHGAKIALIAFGSRRQCASGLWRLASLRWPQRRSSISRSETTGDGAARPSDQAADRRCPVRSAGGRGIPRRAVSPAGARAAHRSTVLGLGAVGRHAEVLRASAAARLDPCPVRPGPPRCPGPTTTRGTRCAPRSRWTVWSRP